MSSPGPGCLAVPWSIVLDTHLGCVINHRPRYVWEAPDRCSSLTSIFLSLPSSLSKINENMSLGEDFKRKKKVEPAPDSLQGEN